MGRKLQTMTALPTRWLLPGVIRKVMFIISIFTIYQVAC